MDYSKLALALRSRADYLADRAQNGEVLSEEKHEYNRVNAELIRVLARLLEGATPYKAFGAPGDWGYSTPIGSALYDAYKA